MTNKPWFSNDTEAIRWMRDEARQWVDDKPEVAAHLFEAAMMFERLKGERDVDAPAGSFLGRVRVWVALAASKAAK